MYFHVDPDNYGRFLRPTKNITGIVSHTEREKTTAVYNFYVSSNNNLK